MPPTINYKKVASRLTAGDPLSLKAYPDGSLVVIAQDGKKHRFSAEQVKDALLKPAPKATPKTKQTPKVEPATKAKSVSKARRRQPSKVTKNLENKG